MVLLPQVLQSLEGRLWRLYREWEGLSTDSWSTRPERNGQRFFFQRRTENRNCCLVVSCRPRPLLSWIVRFEKYRCSLRFFGFLSLSKKPCASLSIPCLLLVYVVWLSCITVLWRLHFGPNTLHEHRFTYIFTVSYVSLLENKNEYTVEYYRSWIHGLLLTRESLWW